MTPGHTAGAANGMAYSTPHDSTAADVLMGHNAYFMGNSGGNNSNYRSPHSKIADTCVTCHMEKSTPQAEYTTNFDGTNHSFKASMDICTDCHGIDPGLGPKLQADTQTLLGQIFSATQSKVISKISGTVTLAYQDSNKAWHTDTGKVASGSVTGSATSLTSYYLSISSGGTTTVFGSTSPDPTLRKTSIPLNQLLPLTSDSDFTLAKIIWNYNLINNDGSLGVHNPNYIRTVLGNTYTAIGEVK